LALLLCGSVLGSVAQETPQVLQPDEAGYSAAMRSALTESIDALERLLRNSDYASQRSIGQGGWSAEDFAAFTAGTLERLGYRTAIVRASDGAAVRVWVLVGIELYGTTVWVPVNPIPNPAGRQMQLGAVTTLGGGLRFDPMYAQYDALVELPENMHPIAVIRPPARILEQQAAAWFGHTSRDPDGEIILFEWTFPGTDPVTTVSSSIWFTFDRVGTYTVTLTVTDNRGAQASTALTVDAVEENDCGCPNN
jgi:hypothetical protein